VGQTLPHAMQLSWQPLVPTRKFRSGVTNFQNGLQRGRLNDIRRADAHALAALDAARQEILSANAPGGRITPGFQF